MGLQERNMNVSLALEGERFALETQSLGQGLRL